MQGLDLSKAFLFDWGLPEMDRKFPGLRKHVAVALLEGSQVLGADDEYSRDHAWGPWLHLLTDGQYSATDEEIESVLTEAAPVEFMGVRRARGQPAARVQPTDRFFQALFLGNLPEEDYDWVHRKPELLESRLYFVKHGAVLFDGPGELTKMRERYSKYPDEILSMRMATCCYKIAHYGEYNFRHRLSQRGDCLPIQIAIGYFIESVLRMYFYLEEDFAPYWKWLSFEFRRRELSTPVADLLSQLPTQSSSEQADSVTKVLSTLRRDMITAQVVPEGIEDSGRVEAPLFFKYMKHIRDSIVDERIKRSV